MHGADVHSAPHLNDIRVILLDIEGTTTPIEFVHQVLFPYARAHIREHLDAHDVEVLRAEFRAESPQSSLPAWDRTDDFRSAETYVYWLMDRDRKSTGLKALQGRIWEAGYAGELKGKGEIYPDVRPAFERWNKAGKNIAIFSSGSVQAQRNLFANTTDGDLSSFLSAYFDTTTGPKRAPGSYGNIAAALHRAPGEVLFISDVTAELDAAAEAGMRTTLCVRGDSTVSANRHPRVQSFDEVA